MKLKKKRKINIKSIYICILFLILLLIIYFLKIFSNKSLPALLSIAESETEKVATILINKSIKEELLATGYEDIITVVRNSNNEIIDLSYNNYKMNELLYNVTNNITNSILNLEKGNIENLNTTYFDKSDFIYEIPLGIIYNIPVLIDISPKVPLKTNMLGSLQTSLDTQVKEYGINNSLIETFININLNIKIIFPFASKNKEINKKIIISTKVIEGKIPTYYGGIIRNSKSVISNID